MKREQDADFSTGQAFRRTLLARKGARSTPLPPHELVRDMVVTICATQVAPSPDDPAEAAEGARVFRGDEGARLASSNPVVIATLDLLDNAKPLGVPTKVLIEAVRRRFERPFEIYLGPPPDGRR